MSIRSSREGVNQVVAVLGVGAWISLWLLVMRLTNRGEREFFWGRLVERRLLDDALDFETATGRPVLLFELAKKLRRSSRKSLLLTVAVQFLLLGTIWAFSAVPWWICGLVLGILWGTTGFADEFTAEFQGLSFTGAVRDEHKAARRPWLAAKLALCGAGALALWLGIKLWNDSAPLEVVSAHAVLGVLLIQFCGIPVRRFDARVRADRPVAFADSSGEENILLLRSFADDEQRLYTPLRGMGPGRSALPSVERFEETLVFALFKQGDVLAIGRPGEPRPQLGADRSYWSNESWKDAVVTTASRAKGIVAIAGLTDGLDWEVTQLRDLGLLPKTLIVFPCDTEERSHERYHRVWKQVGAGGMPAPDRLVSRICALGFDENCAPLHFLAQGRDWSGLTAAVGSFSEILDGRLARPGEGHLHDQLLSAIHPVFDAHHLVRVRDATGDARKVLLQAKRDDPEDPDPIVGLAWFHWVVENDAESARAVLRQLPALCGPDEAHEISLQLERVLSGECHPDTLLGLDAPPDVDLTRTAAAVSVGEAVITAQDPPLTEEDQALVDRWRPGTKFRGLRASRILRMIANDPADEGFSLETADRCFDLALRQGWGAISLLLLAARADARLEADESSAARRDFMTIFNTAPYAESGLFPYFGKVTGHLLRVDAYDSLLGLNPSEPDVVALALRMRSGCFKQGDVRKAMQCGLDVASALDDAGSPDCGLWCETVVAEADRIGVIPEKARALGLWSSHHLRSGDPQEAVRLATASADVARMAQFEPIIGLAQARLGDALRESGDPEGAYTAYLAACETLTPCDPRNADTARERLGSLAHAHPRLHRDRMADNLRDSLAEATAAAAIELGIVPDANMSAVVDLWMAALERGESSLNPRFIRHLDDRGWQVLLSLVTHPRFSAASKESRDELAASLLGTSTEDHPPSSTRFHAARAIASTYFPNWREGPSENLDLAAHITLQVWNAPVPFDIETTRAGHKAMGDWAVANRRWREAENILIRQVDLCGDVIKERGPRDGYALGHMVEAKHSQLLVYRRRHHWDELLPLLASLREDSTKLISIQPTRSTVARHMRISGLLALRLEDHASTVETARFLWADIVDVYDKNPVVHGCPDAKMMRLSAFRRVERHSGIG